MEKTEEKFITYSQLMKKVDKLIRRDMSDLGVMSQNLIAKGIDCNQVINELSLEMDKSINKAMNLVKQNGSFEEVQKVLDYCKSISYDVEGLKLKINKTIDELMGEGYRIKDENVEYEL